MSTETCTVVGTTRDHCGRSVSTKLSAADGVTDVDVEASAGTVTVTSDTAVSSAEVREAVGRAARAGARLV